jgi:hypothetical protein
VKSNIGRIRRRRGWKVNAIYFNPGKDRGVSWNCTPARRFWIFVPPGKLPSTHRVAFVKSSKGKAFLKLRGTGLKKYDRIYYSILLDDGKKIQMVRGSSPPVIIIWP